LKVDWKAEKLVDLLEKRTVALLEEYLGEKKVE
jgi:hypothetical protein